MTDQDDAAKPTEDWVTNDLPGEPEVPPPHRPLPPDEPLTPILPDPGEPGPVVPEPNPTEPEPT